MKLYVLFCAVCGCSPERDYFELPKYIRCKECKKHRDYEYVEIPLKYA